MRMTLVDRSSMLCMFPVILSVLVSTPLGKKTKWEYIVKVLSVLNFNAQGIGYSKPFLSLVPTHSVFFIKSAEDCEGGVISVLFLQAAKMAAQQINTIKCFFILIIF